MKTAIAKLLSSAKFWTTIIGGLVTAGASLLARYGLEVSDLAVQQVALTVSGLFGLLLLGQASADHGKEAAKIHAAAPAKQINAVGETVNVDASTTPPAGFVRLPLLIALAALASVALWLSACGGVKETATRAAEGFVDCMKPETKSFMESLLPLAVATVVSAVANDGRVDYEQLKAPARALRSPAERCLMATAIAEVARARTSPDGPQSSPLQVDVDQAKAGFAAMSAELWGGEKFATPGGTL